MKNWREMEAGRELDQFIAELQGFGVSGPVGFHQTLLLTNAGDRTGWTLPRYTTDLNAAFDRLPLEEHVYLSLRTPQNGQGYTAFVYYETPTENDFRSAVANSPALAVCRAWLAWNTRDSK